jgi:uncharacterized membrane protein
VPSKRKDKEREQRVAARKREVVQRETQRSVERTVVGIQSETRISAYQGPLPPPELLRELDEIVPGASARLFTLFEDQARHRMDLERRAIGADIIQSRLGLVAGCLIALAVSGEGAFLIWSGAGATGLVALVTPIVALVSVFVYGTKSRKDERLQKAERQASLRKR